MTVDFELKAGVADVIFEREVRKVAVPIQWAGAAFAELDGVRAGWQVITFEHESVVECEQVLGVDFFFFAFLAIDPHLNREVGLVFAGGFDEIGEGFDHERCIAGAVPVGSIFAIVDEVLYQLRRDGAFRVGRCEQFEVVRFGLVFAAVPEPPDVGGHVQIRRLVFVVLDDELADVLHDHVQLFGFVLLVEGEAVGGEGVDGELRAIFIEPIAHGVAFHVGIGEDHVHERVDVVGVSLGWFLFVADVAFVVDVGKAAELFFLVVLEPFDAAIENAGHQSHVVLLGDLQAMDDGGRGVGSRCFAPAAEPSPAAIAELHFLEPIDAGFYDF